MDAADLEPQIVELVAVPAPVLAGAVRELAFRANAWLPQEDAQLRELFAADAPIGEMAEAIGRRFQAVRQRICTLGLRRNSQRPWSELEDAEVLRRYGPETAAAIAQDLGRGVPAIYNRARLLGMAEAIAPDWTAWEDAQLRAGYAQGAPVAQIAVIIGRSYSGANSRAYELRLRHLYQPVGWSAEELTRALALAHEGHRYLEVIELLVAEGFPRRTKLGLGPMLKRLGYGRGWGRRWAAEEDDLLRRAYSRGDSLRELGRSLNRPPGSLRWRAEALELRGSHPNHDGFRQGPCWTPKEDARLREVYGKIKTSELPALFGRPKGGIFQRAFHLGIRHGYWRPYAEDEVRAIRIAWKRGIGVTDLAVALGRNPQAIYKQLDRLNLSFSDPARPVASSRARRAKRAAPLSLSQILQLEEAEPA
ncbi:MAG TPA: hypothetical protein VG248_17440 [Caulobacteraceae bacterium]|jgi:hypothetical protein|nr:hypothetical protein [Caulobacteraceae bacterium]